MPKSKRAKVVPLTRTVKQGFQAKETLISEVGWSCFAAHTRLKGVPEHILYTINVSTARIVLLKNWDTPVTSEHPKNTILEEVLLRYTLQYYRIAKCITMATSYSAVVFAVYCNRFETPQTTFRLSLYFLLKICAMRAWRMSETNGKRVDFSWEKTKSWQSR